VIPVSALVFEDALSRALSGIGGDGEAYGRGGVPVGVVERVSDQAGQLVGLPITRTSSSALTP
jgi:hypothetical protein